MRSFHPYVLLSVLLMFGCSDDTGGNAGTGGDAGQGGSGGTGGNGGMTGGLGPIDDSVIAELLLIPGFVPAANPETSEETPAMLNQARINRYRANEDPAPAPRAIIVAVPGFLGGGPSFDGLARAMVRWGAQADFPVEVWAIDRRSNGLEDLTGMNAAERDGDAEIATRYYFEGEEVDGQVFAGYAPQSSVSYMSEWGLETHIEDLRAVIDLIPANEQRGHIFMAGHSFGASLTEQYAAWRFASDDKRGAEQLAGMIFLDGLMGDTPSEQEDFESGLADIRTGDRYTTLPLLGIDVYTVAEIGTLRAWFDPSGVTADERRDMAVRILTGLTEVPQLTNAAAAGIGFDSMYQPLGFVRMSLGDLTGGPVEEYESALAGGATLFRPTDPSATYDWIDAFDLSPPDFTPLVNYVVGFTIGQSNFAEWYFPSRISLDSGAARGTGFPEDGWQTDYGIRAFDGALNGAPALCIPGALVGDTARCDALRTRLAPTVGEGRPQAGATRPWGASGRRRDTDVPQRRPPVGRNFRGQSDPGCRRRLSSGPHRARRGHLTVVLRTLRPKRQTRATLRSA
ncbi:MAG: hypothetical protein WBG86_22270 [Polyangiales bacterium]